LSQVAAPCVSIVLMVLFLALTQAGGLWAIAGGAGFSINLMTAVYSLILIGTMDGGAVWKWNRALALSYLVPSHDRVLLLHVHDSVKAKDTGPDGPPFFI